MFLGITTNTCADINIVNIFLSPNLEPGAYPQHMFWLCNFLKIVIDTFRSRPR